MLSLADVTVDPEFEACCPALSSDERLQLLANITRDGFRESIIVWLGRGILIDGHNRLDIWRTAFSSDLDNGPEIIERPFKDREDAMGWIVRNQLGRRNLTDAQRVVLAMKLKPALAAKAKENQSVGGAAGAEQTNRGLTISSNPVQPVNVRAEVAKAAGVSEDTVAKVSTVIASGDQQTTQDMLAGKVSVNAAAKRVKAAADQQAPKPQREMQGKGIVYANEAINALNRIPKNDALRTRGFQVAADHIATQCPEALNRSATDAPPVATLESLQAAFLKLPTRQRREFIGFAIQRNAPPKKIPAHEAELLDRRISDLESLVDRPDGVATAKEIKFYTNAVRSTCRKFLGKTVKPPETTEGGRR